MYLILFDGNNQANCIVPCKNITKDNIYLFDELPDFTPQEGYANLLHLNGNSLEWHFTKLPETKEPTQEEIEEMASGTKEYQIGYDRAVLDIMEAEL